MKNSLILGLVLFVNIALSQTKVKFTFTNSCPREQIEDYNIWMSSLDDETINYWAISKDSIVTIKKGVYIVTVYVGKGDYFKTYSFTKEFKSDSIYTVVKELPRIMSKYTRAVDNQKFLGFYNCDKVCNGKLQDFYENGKIRMEGEFKNGIPVKQIKKYNELGELVEIEIYNRNGTYRKSKYPDYENFLKNN